MILKLTADEISLNSRKSQVFLINTDELGNAMDSGHGQKFVRHDFPTADQALPCKQDNRTK